MKSASTGAASPRSPRPTCTPWWPSRRCSCSLTRKPRSKALPRLLPSKADRERAVAIVARIMMLEPALSDPDSPMAKMVKEFLDLDPKWHMIPSLVVQGGTS